jgi:hypothetical protein
MYGVALICVKMPASISEPLATSGRRKLFRLIRSPWPLFGPRADIVGLYGQICRALPPDLAEQLKSLDTTNGIRVTLRTGETFRFMPNTTVKAIVAGIVERRHATSGTFAAATEAPASPGWRPIKSPAAAPDFDRLRPRREEPAAVTA